MGEGGWLSEGVRERDKDDGPEEEVRVMKEQRAGCLLQGDEVVTTGGGCGGGSDGREIGELQEVDDRASTRYVKGAAAAVG